MPIPVNQLKGAQAPLPERVLAFLKQNAQQAYSLVEIHVALEGYDSSIGPVMVAMLGAPQRRAVLEPLRAVLAELETRGLIISAQQQGSVYYAAASGR